MTDKPAEKFEDMVHRFRTNWHAAQSLARRTMEASYAAGQDLAQIKERVPHGQWLPWLEAEGVNKSTASRLMTLGRMQISQIEKFGNITQALSAVKEQRPLPLGDNDTRQPEIVDAEPKQVGNENGASPVGAAPQAGPVRNDPRVDHYTADAIHHGAAPREEPEIDDTEVLRMRMEAAEQEANDARLALQEERERREAVTQELSEADDSPQALAVLQETEGATQATVRARDELARVQARLQNAMRTIDAQNRRINGIKRDLLAGMAGGDVLVKYYGVGGNGETEYRNDAMLEGE